MSSHDFDIIGIGASTLDILTSVDAFPQGREVHEAKDVKMEGGGPVATALAAAAKLGGRCQMLDEVGDDSVGKAICADFEKYGVDTSAIYLSKGKASAVASVMVNSLGERAVYYRKGGTEDLSMDMRKEALNRIPYGKVLHINGRHLSILEEAIDVAHRAGVFVSFDGGADRYRPETRELAEQAEICIVARDFAEKYTGMNEYEGMVRALFSKRTMIAGVTDGVRGSYIMERGGSVFHQPAYKMERIVDTTGCGDSYHGAFLYGWTLGWDAMKCARIASCVAAMNTQALGGRSALPSLQETNDFIANRI